MASQKAYDETFGGCEVDRLRCRWAYLDEEHLLDEHEGARDAGLRLVRRLQQRRRLPT